MSGRVVLVGAGPGDPDLLTVRAARELAHAEVLMYDALVPAAILALAPEHCERIDVGKRGDGTRGVPQTDIAKLMIEKARAGHDVVRLKGGDPFVFGRGGEEASALAEAGISFEIVPGISSIFAAPAYAGIPLTDRRAASSFAVITGHRAADPDANPSDWEGLAQSADTLIVLMGTTWLEEITQRVIDGGRDPRTPAAVIANGSTPEQRVVVAPLQELAARVREAGLRAPTITIIGEVARFRESLAWFERRPLFGRRVLVLRAQTQSQPLEALLVRAAARPVSVPLLAFEPSGDPAVLAGADFDWVVFSSANAVRFAAPHLAAPPPRVACIGAATAAAARQAGLAPELIPEGAALPETLVRGLAAHAKLEAARVLLPQGREARDTLGSALAAAGADLCAVEVYRNVTPPGAAECVRGALAEGVEAVLLTSPSTVERLAAALPDGGLAGLAEAAVLACIGPTTADALAHAGARAAVVADEQSAEGLVAALEQHFREGSHAVSG